MSGPPKPKIDDNTPMPIGSFKDIKMIDVPAWHLLWYWEQPWLEDKYPALYAYIEDNRDALQQENSHK